MILLNRLAAALVSLVPLMAAMPADASEEVPFGDKVSERIVNYNRTQPHIATSGLVREGGVEELKALGFAAILDLRMPEEGTQAEREAAEKAGLAYFNIPIAAGAPTPEQVREFATIVEDGANAPLLVHCASANRAGAMWVLYRVSEGIPFSIAVVEGRTIGLKPERETAVRERLGEPPIPD